MSTGLPQKQGHRDRAWVEREYNREKYPRILEAARRALSAGERDLPRIVGQVCAQERGNMTLSMHRDAVIDGKIVQAPLLFSVAGISGFIVEALAEACSADTQTVIELGAGWGRNLFLLHLSGRIAAKTDLYALEFAETARMAGTLIANTVPNLPFKAAGFDYHAPDYGAIPPSDAPTVMATIHSIEQIPQLKRDVFLNLLARRPNLRGIHLEPVSFQIPADRRSMRPAQTSAAYAETHDYNRNLWTVLSKLEAENLIEIEEVVPDILGLNPSNAASLILWRAKRPHHA
jgi:hypothetical protein